MGTQREILDLTTEAVIECEAHPLCECLSCDDARRARVRAFCERWFTKHPAVCPFTDVVSEESGVRAAPTMRPPSRQQKVA